MDNLIKKVFTRVRPKVIDNQILNGKMLCELANAYIQTLNSDAIPTISTAWERVVDGELRRVYDQACDELEFFLKQIIAQRFPIDDQELKNYLNQGRKKALTTLNSPTLSNAPPDKLLTIRVAFDEKFDHLSALLYQNNFLASQKKCEELLKNFHDSIYEKVS